MAHHTLKVLRGHAGTPNASGAGGTQRARHKKYTITIMKHSNFLFTLLAFSAFVVGCDKETTTSQQIDKVQAETKQAAQDMKDYTYAQKSAFVETMQGQLTALNRDLDQLSAKVEKSSDTAKAEAKPKLQALRDQADKLNQQLDKAKNATESTWDDVKSGAKKAYDQLKDGFQQARQWVSDKIAP
jgi:cytochrome c556